MMFPKILNILKKEKKLVLTAVVILVMFYVLTPGVFFQIPSKNKEDKAFKISTGIHAVVYTLLITIFIYFIKPCSSSLSPSL